MDDANGWIPGVDLDLVESRIAFTPSILLFWASSSSGLVDLLDLL